MCGLVGVYGNLFSKDISYFKQALICDVFRGPDSTGLAVLPMSGGAEVIKKVMNPMDFLGLRAVDNALSVSKLGFIGHNRKATLGGINQENAHPFTHGNITLAHNGTLTNKWRLEKDMLSEGGFQTDSELVCFLLDNFTIDEVIPKLEGAFALTWFDESDRSLNIIRNDEREFSIAVGDNKIYWASEADMMKWLLTRTANPVIDKKKMQVISPAPGSYFKFTYVKGKVVCNTRTVELAPPPKTYSPKIKQSYGQSNLRNNRIGSPPDEKKQKGAGLLEQYNKTYGTNYRIGDYVYTYFEKKSQKVSSKVEEDKVNLSTTLATVPYHEVRCYYTDDLKLYYNDSVTNPCNGCYRMKLTAAVRADGVWHFVVNNKDIEPVITEKDEEHMNAWVDRNPATYPEVLEEKNGNKLPLTLVKKTPEALQGEVISSSTSDAPFEVQDSNLAGFQGASISKAKFKEVCKKGCAICTDPLDLDAELVDRSVHFISEEDAVCAFCAHDKNHQEYYGFQKPSTSPPVIN